MRLGVSSACFYPQKTEESIRYLLENNVKELEIFINTQSEMSADYLKKLSSLCKSFGGRIKAVHPFTSGVEDFMLFSPYERRFEDILDYYRKSFFEAANALGADIFVLHGARLSCRISEEACFERFAKLCDAGKALGVKVAQENVFDHAGCDPEYLLRMGRYIGEDFGIVFDIKQAIKSGKDPYLFAKMLKENICHVHISDNSSKGNCLLPGCGEMDFSKLMEIIKSCGNDPSVIVEVYSSCYDEKSQVIDSVRFLSQKLNIEL